MRNQRLLLHPITRLFFFLKKIWRVLIRQRSQITLLGNARCALKGEKNYLSDNLALAV